MGIPVGTKAQVRVQSLAAPEGQDPAPPLQDLGDDFGQPAIGPTGSGSAATSSPGGPTTLGRHSS
nr:hypothetical protein Ade03nite_83170 [Actinoplanes derwentensis]